MVLDNLWALYDAIIVSKDVDKMHKIVKSLNIELGIREQRLKDPRATLQSIMSSWLPCARRVLDTVARQIPSPTALDADRARILLHMMVESLLTSCFSTFLQRTAIDAEQQSSEGDDERENLREQLFVCMTDATVPTPATLVFVSKMIAVERSALPGGL